MAILFPFYATEKEILACISFVFANYGKIHFYKCYHI